MTKLIINSIDSEENRVRNFALKYERVLGHIRLVGIVEILNIVMFIIAVILDGPVGTNGKSMYRSVSTMFLANASFIVILVPLLFDGIRTLKFSQDQLKAMEMKSIDEAR
jgi:uncharacterized membrane protein